MEELGLAITPAHLGGAGVHSGLERLAARALLAASGVIARGLVIGLAPRARRLLWAGSPGLAWPGHLWPGRQELAGRLVPRPGCRIASKTVFLMKKVFWEPKKLIRGELGLPIMGVF